MTEVIIWTFFLFCATTITAFYHDRTVFKFYLALVVWACLCVLVLYLFLCRTQTTYVRVCSCTRKRPRTNGTTLSVRVRIRARRGNAHPAVVCSNAANYMDIMCVLLYGTAWYCRKIMHQHAEVEPMYVRARTTHVRERTLCECGFMPWPRCIK